MTETFDELPSHVKEWTKNRPRTGKVDKVVAGRAEKYPEKNAGVAGRVIDNDHIHCPCTICGHQYQVDCEEADCACCSSTCT